MKRITMDSELAALISTASSALISTLATDLWTQAKQAVMRLWTRCRPAQAPAVEEFLNATRAKLITADGAELQNLAKLAEGRLQGRFEALIAEVPQAAAELREAAMILVELSAGTSQPVVQHVRAGRDAYTAGRDQHFGR